MAKINLLLTDANDNLLEVKGEILRAIRRIEDVTLNNLGIEQDINVLITNRAPWMVIKEDGVGGFTYSQDFIFFSIDEEKVKEDFIFEMLSHELCHAKRLSVKPAFPRTLLEAIINEGFATFYESQIAKDSRIKQFLIKTVEQRSKNENMNILNYCTPYLDKEEYSDDIFFFRGNKSIPRWAGYSLGYEIIKEYSAIKKQSFLDVLLTDYNDIIGFVKNEMAQK